MNHDVTSRFPGWPIYPVMHVTGVVAVAMLMAGMELASVPALATVVNGGGWRSVHLVPAPCTFQCDDVGR